MCLAHGNSQAQSQDGGTAVVERPSARSGRANERSRANQTQQPSRNREKPKTRTAQSAPSIPGIASTRLPSVLSKSIARPVSKTAPQPEPEVSTPREVQPKPAKPLSREIFKPLPKHSPKKQEAASQDSSRMEESESRPGKQVLNLLGEEAEVKPEKTPAVNEQTDAKVAEPTAEKPQAKTRELLPKRENPVTTVADLVSRSNLKAVDIIPENQLTEAGPANLSNLVKDLLSYELNKSFDPMELRTYEVRALYAVNLLLFPDDRVRYPNLTSFVSDVKSKFKANAVKEKAYKRLVELGQASGDKNQDTAKLPRCFDEYLRSK